MKTLIQIKKDPQSHKIGIDEVVGLKEAMNEAVKPIRDLINDKVYWGPFEFEPSEYKSRDGFIPYSHNCGGLDLTVLVPKCEEYGWDFLEFGECDVCGTAECVNDKGEAIQCGYKGEECSADSGGYNDAKLRIWLKFEGINEETGELEFYLYAGGGNGDAPYFRTKYEVDIFEASFSCKSVAGIKRASSKHVKALIKKLGGAK